MVEHERQEHQDWRCGRPGTPHDALGRPTEHPEEEHPQLSPFRGSPPRSAPRRATPLAVAVGRGDRVRSTASRLNLARTGSRPRRLPADRRRSGPRARRRHSAPRTSRPCSPPATGPWPRGRGLESDAVAAQRGRPAIAGCLSMARTRRREVAPLRGRRDVHPGPIQRSDVRVTTIRHHQRCLLWVERCGILPKSMFEELIRELGRMHGTQKISVSLPTDSEGYFDRECPSPECQCQFKVHEDDWRDKVRDEEV